MHKIEKILLDKIRPYVQRSKFAAGIFFVLKCRESGYRYNRILKVFL